MFVPSTKSQREQAALVTSPTYAGWWEELKASLKSSGDAGFYLDDKPGFGWYYDNGDGSLVLVFAPKGGQRISYYPQDEVYSEIFARVVTGKEPLTKESLAEAVKASGGIETSGATVPATGTPTASAVEQAEKTRKGSGSRQGKKEKVWEKAWFIPALLGIGLVVSVAAIASKPKGS